MDTIIYLFRQKKPERKKEQQGLGSRTFGERQQGLESRASGEIQEGLDGSGTEDMQELYRREDVDMPDYHLIRVEMSEQLLRICQDNCMQEQDRRKDKPGGFFARRRRKEQLQQERMLLAEFLREMLGEQNAGKIDGVQENGGFGCFVCQEPMPYFAERYFNDYFAAGWVRHMLRYGGYAEGMTYTRGDTDDSRSGTMARMPLTHFMILGQTACVPEILCEHVRGIKSLKWILPQRQFREEQQELVDMLSEEYGLAAEVRLLSEEESYRQVYPVCRVPSLVLDFSEEDRIPTADVVRGSIWLDMAASEEKRRRIEDRDTGIHYFSLKKEWKQPQKALNYLDTTGKNGYNT